MTPEFDLRLKSMRRALTAVIMPAIERDNQLAQEQAALLVAHLDMIAAQWSRVDAYARLCRDALAELVARIEVSGGLETIAAGKRLSELAQDRSLAPSPGFHAMSAALEALVRAVDRDGDPAFRAALHRDVLLYGRDQAARDRSWFIQCGFDVNAGELADIDAILARHAESHTQTQPGTS